jgi:ribonuclease H / adenosylcobalamin/alpha-ribazole phosphatase
LKTAILARHAESELGAQGRVNGDAGVENTLTTAGEEQARRLGAVLADTELDLAVSTEFPRVRRTVEIALESREVPLLMLPELNEIRFGRWEGLPAEEYLAWAWANGPEEPCPGGGESRVEAVRRLARGFGTILERPERTVLVVGHGLALRYVLNAVEGGDPRPVLDQVPLAEPIPIEEADFRRAVERLEHWLEAPAW